MLRGALYIAAIVMIPISAAAHGPTICVGSITYSDQTSVSLDLRFGVGLLHKQVDPNDDAFVSDDEWNKSLETLTQFFRKGIEVRANGSAVEAHHMELRLTSGSEIQVLADLTLPDGATSASLALPVLRHLPALPPSVISVWKDKKMVKPPHVLWFGKTLDFKTSN